MSEIDKSTSQTPQLQASDTKALSETKTSNESDNCSSSSEQATISVASSDIETQNDGKEASTSNGKQDEPEDYDEYDEYDDANDDEYLNDEEIKKEPFAAHNTSSCSSADHAKTGVPSPPEFESMHPKLKKILKTYRLNARKNIHGPSNYKDELANISPPPPTSSSTSAPTSSAPPSAPTPAPISSHQVQGHPIIGQGHTSNDKTITRDTLSDIPAARLVQSHRVLMNDSHDLDNWSAPPPNTSVRRYANMSSESGRTDKCETVLHGERITCFEVGGEKRLCLAEILNFILKDFTVQQINNVCERLHIYCSRCTNEQLDILKQNQILPVSAPSCGLITLTDAERLCSVLLNETVSKPKSAVISPSNPSTAGQTLRVSHKCFGRTHGTVHTNLYRKPASKCIECDTCHLFYSPMNFVSHSHRSEESRICHWGFDSNNWRLYLSLSSPHRDDQRAQIDFEAFKAKFNQPQNTQIQQQQQNLAINPLKRKTLLEFDNDAMYDEMASSFSSKRLNESVSSSSHEDDMLKSVSVDASLSKKMHKLISVQDTAKSVSDCEHKLLNSLLSKSSPKHTNTAAPQPPIHFTPSLVSNSNSPKSIEALFDEMQSEIDSCVPSIDARKRLAFYISQIQQAFNEKILYVVKSRIELQEAANATQLENEALKARVKYLDIENQLLVSGTKGMLASTQPHNAAFSALTRHLYQSQPQLYPVGLQMSPPGSSGKEVSSCASTSAQPSKYFAGKSAFSALANTPFHGQYVANALKCEMMSSQ